MKMRKVEWSRKTIFIALLTVVLPISLVVAFQLTNMRREPELKTVTVEAASWRIDRPSDYINFKERIENELISWAA